MINISDFYNFSSFASCYDLSYNTNLYHLSISLPLTAVYLSYSEVSNDSLRYAAPKAPKNRPPKAM